MQWKPPSDKTVYNLDAAYGIAREKMSLVDIKQQCLNSGAVLDNQNTVRIDFINENYTISINSGAVTLTSAERDVPLRNRILMLHYFIKAKGTQLTGNQITYRQLPGGLIYYPTFVQRTIKRLIEFYGNKTQDFIKAGQTLGGETGCAGDASVVIRAFPRVPVNLILWQGDNELTPQLNILFDANISDYLEPEDITVMCEIIAGRLIATAGNIL
jgi:hypothetical protein